jgi:hypothetical protein
MTNLSISSLGSIDFGHLGWRYYHNIKKKAMEQEFSWSGLVISLSIAFFIVIVCAYGLNLAYHSVTAVQDKIKMQELRIYRLEAVDHSFIGLPQVFEAMPALPLV